MICMDCHKDLKGGFGVGERPFKKFRCFECLMFEYENAKGWMLLDQISEGLPKALAKDYGETWKQYALSLEEEVRRIEYIIKISKRKEGVFL